MPLVAAKSYTGQILKSQRPASVLFQCSDNALISPDLFELLAPLHLVCHQTRRETSGMPFALNAFVLDGYNECIEMLERYHNQLPLISTVRVPVWASETGVLQGSFVLGADLKHRLLLLERPDGLKHVAVSFDDTYQYCTGTQLQGVMAGVKEVFDSSVIAQKADYIVLGWVEKYYS